VTGKVDIGSPFDYNWLQPFEALQGRSFLQFFVGSKEVRNQIHPIILKEKYKKTLLSQIEEIFDLTSKVC
jgi:hypothetical protein